LKTSDTSIFTQHIPLLLSKQQCQSTKGNLEAVTSTSENYPMISSFLERRGNDPVCWICNVSISLYSDRHNLIKYVTMK